MKNRLALLLLAPPLAALALAGCGGGGDSTGSAESSKSRGPDAADFRPKPHHDSGGGSAQFEVKGADNSVQEFGAEASESELRQAAAALHGFLDARAARNFAAACTYLDTATRQGFAQLGSAPARPCAAGLAALTGNTPVSTLREAAVADVGSLRSEGNRGFLIYRGAADGVYAIPVEREAGAWKVASLSPVPLY